MTPTPAMIDRGVAFALNVSLSADYTWSQYVADLYATMDAARATTEPNDRTRDGQKASPPSPRGAGQEGGDWVLVPREPTEAMDAASHSFRKGVGESAGRLWAAMIAAAPSPPAGDA